MDARGVAYKKMLNAEFNRLYYVHRAASYRRRGQLLDWAILTLSSGAVGAWAAQASPVWAALLSVAVAVCAGASRAFRWSERAGKYDLQKELWWELRSNFEDVYDRLTRDEAVHEAEIRALDAQYVRVFGQEQEAPSEKFRQKLQDQVLRLFHREDQITVSGRVA